MNLGDGGRRILPFEPQSEASLEGIISHQVGLLDRE
jgi:hypothetical protein